MKVILYNAISVDGYIATPDGNVDWINTQDWDIFRDKVKTAKVIVMGSTTYRTSGSDFPYDCELNIVMTHQKELLAKSDDKRIFFTDKTPAELVEYVASQGFETLLIIGGGTINGSFLQANIIDEIVLDVHPVILGSGIKLFEHITCEVKLEMLTTKELNDGLLLTTYKVIKE